MHKTKVPEWLHFPHITTGYRYKESMTYYTCLHTLFTLHNESISIVTMILANFVATLLFVYSLIHFPYSLKCLSAFFALYMTSTLHLPFSVGYHLFLPISPSVYNLWRRLDLIFIFVSAILSTYALSILSTPYFVTIILTISSIIISSIAWKYIYKLREYEQLNKVRHTLLIASVVMIFILPMIYKSITSEFGYIQISTIGTIISLLTGAIVYAKNIPESLCAEKFDILCNSHSIMHLCLIAAHVFQFIFIFTLTKAYL